MNKPSPSPVPEIAKLLALAILRGRQKQLDLSANGSIYRPSEGERA